MRRFRFVGDPSEYLWDEIPVLGKVYPETHTGKIKSADWESDPLSKWHTADLLKDWQEVFYEPIIKGSLEVDPNATITNSTLLKDTDLGYFAGLIIPSVYQSWGSGHDERVIEESISLAYQLIKQLEKESK
jgi:hypothetical protein